MIRNWYIKLGLAAIRRHKPQGVRVTRADGEEIPVRLRFVGVDKDGVYRWVIIPPTNTGPLRSIDIREMPGRTAIGWPASLGVGRRVQ